MHTCHSIAAIHLPLYKQILLFWTNSCSAIKSMYICVNDQHAFLFIVAFSQQEGKWKVWSDFSYCCSQIILVLMLQSICGTVFFSCLHHLFSTVSCWFSFVLCQCCLWTSGTYWLWYSLLHWTFMQLGSVSQLSVVYLSCTPNKKSSPLCRLQILTIAKMVITASTSDPRIIVSVVAFNKYLNEFIKVAHS